MVGPMVGLMVGPVIDHVSSVGLCRTVVTVVFKQVCDRPCIVYTNG